MDILNTKKAFLYKLKPIIMSEEKIEIATAETNLGIENQNLTTEDSPAVADPTVLSESLQSTTPPPTLLNIFSAIVNGAGIGLLLGILVSVTISPVVSGVVTTLSGLLALLIGLNEKYISVLKSFRIGAFGFFCATGIFLGMAVRTNHLLLPSREKMMEEYTKVGFKEEQARDFIAFREFGLVPSSWTDSQANSVSENSDAVDMTPRPVDSVTIASSHTIEKQVNVPSNKSKIVTHKLINSNETVMAQSSLLYSSTVNADACQNLYATDISLTKAVIKNNFTLAEGTWKEMAQAFDPLLSEDVYKQTLLIIRDCFCEGKMSGGNIKISRITGKIDQNQSLEKIKKEYQNSGQIWKRIEEKISNTIPVENQKIIFITTFKILSHD
jgi:hypothetical protein